MATYDINTIEFEKEIYSGNSMYVADLVEVDGVTELQAIWDIDYTDRPTASLVIGNPQTGEWYSSTDTRDWPKLDEAFGREAWQKFLAEKTEEALAEIEED